MEAHKRPTALAHLLLGQVIRPGDLVIDATAGNGHDTLFLATAVGEGGRVLAFDVQAAAIDATRGRLEAAGLAGRVTLIEGSHAGIADHAAAGTVAAVMFNLGYLPGHDHGRITEAGETIAALDASARVLRRGGLLSVVCYPGHLGGGHEAESVGEWFFKRAAEGWTVTRHGAIGCRRPPPFLLLGAAA